MAVAGPEPITPEPITHEELQLAARNHGMPLEALRWPLTPVGLHYLLIHYDIPMVDPATAIGTSPCDVVNRRCCHGS